MMATYDTVTLHKAVTANGTSAAGDLGELTDAGALVISTTGAPTFSYQLTGSADGITFVNVGTAVSAVGQTRIDFSTSGPCRYFKGVLTALSGGTFTAKVAGIGGQ
jgi:hypothetical protein